MAIVLKRQTDPSRGTSDRFDEVARRELPVLYRVARRLTRHDEDAEDLVAQTLLRASRAWVSFDGRYPRSWLVRILQNEFYHSRRRRDASGTVSIDEIEEPSDEGFWEALSWSVVGEDIIRELDALPDQYRLVVALCDVEEMSYEEAARSLDIPVGTVRSRLFRGRRLLRARLVHLVDSTEET